MSVKHVCRVGWVFRGTNADEVVVLFGRDDPERRTEEDAWAAVRRLAEPVTNCGIAFSHSDGTVSRLSVIGHPTVLPDQTGTLIVFEPGKYMQSDGSDVFHKPNNAAIYNADGSLRFQIQLPQGAMGDRIGGVHSGAMPENFRDMLGVVIATHPQSDPEWVYAVDPDQPELIATHQWVRW